MTWSYFQSFAGVDGDSSLLGYQHCDLVLRPKFCLSMCKETVCSDVVFPASLFEGQFAIDLLHSCNLSTGVNKNQNKVVRRLDVSTPLLETDLKRPIAN